MPSRPEALVDGLKSKWTSGGPQPGEALTWGMLCFTLKVRPLEFTASGILEHVITEKA